MPPERKKTFRTPRDRTEILFVDKKSPLIFLPPGLIKKIFRKFPIFLDNQEFFQGQQEDRGHAVAISELQYFIIYNKPTRCNSGSIVFINNYKYALHVSDALCVYHQEHYKL